MKIKLKIGNMLFRHRSITPLPVIALIFIFFEPKIGNGNAVLLNFFGLSFALFGEIIRVITVGYSFCGSSGRENFLRADKLNRTGIYSIVRNPLYIGNFIIFNGLLIAYVNVWGSLVMSGFLFMQYYFIISAEEEYLKEKYGDEYLKYRQKVNRFIPKFVNFSPPANKFDLRRVIFAEKDSIFNLLCMFIIVLFFREYSIQGAISNYFYYLIPAVVIIFVYIYLKIIKVKSGKSSQS